jgi:hypothetical protein
MRKLHGQVGHNVIIEPADSEPTPLDVSPAPTLDDLCDVVGNRGWFNVLLVNGVTVRASSSFPVLSTDVLTYMDSQSLFQGPLDLIISSSGGIFFQTNSAGAWKWKMDKTTGSFIPFGTNNSADIGDTSYCVRNILWGGIMIPRGTGREMGVVQNRVKAGTPTDADMPVYGISDGALVVDTTGNKIWVRIGGTWKGVAVA